LILFFLAVKGNGKKGENHDFGLTPRKNSSWNGITLQPKKTVKFFLPEEIDEL
jgi:hypothetical protein